MSSGTRVALPPMLLLPSIVALLSFAGAEVLADELPEVSAHASGSAGSSRTPVPRDAGWAVQKRNDDPATGWVLYKRAVPGSAFEAFRLEAEIDAPPHIVAASLRQNIRDPHVSQANTEKKVLEDEGDVVLVYSYIALPLVSDRDVVTRSRRLPAEDDGRQRFEWEATVGGPAPLDGVIRLRESSGFWDFRPLPGERSFAVYESHVDIGGSIPAWLVNRLMVDTVVDGLTALRRRVDRNMAQIAAGAPEAPRRRLRPVGESLSFEGGSRVSQPGRPMSR